MKVKKDKGVITKNAKSYSKGYMKYPRHLNHSGVVSQESTKLSKGTFLKFSYFWNQQNNIASMSTI